MSSAFEIEIKRQIEAKQAQRLKDKLSDQQATLDQYKNYPLPGGQHSTNIPHHYSQLSGLNNPQELIQKGAFTGDMNAIKMPAHFDEKPANLFDQGFLSQGQQYGSIQAQENKDLNHMSDRERRLYLRERERELRNQKPAAGIQIQPKAAPQETPYGGVIPQVSPEPAPSVSKRDLMLQMKAQQRNQLFVAQDESPHMDFDQFKPAVAAEQQFNLPLKFHPPSTPQRSSPDHQKRASPQQQMQQVQDFGIGRHSDQTYQKRQEQNLQRQEDYRRHLIQQEAKRQLQQELPPDHPIQTLLQVGDHEYSQTAEAKRTKQQEYASELQAQLKTNKVQDTPQLSKEKKKMLAEEIFNDVLLSESSKKIPQSMLIQQETPSRVPPPVSSSRRQQEVEKLQMQQTRQMFGSNHEHDRLQALEKKREYAMQLQQQIEQKQTPQRNAAAIPPASARHQPQQPSQQMDFYSVKQQINHMPPPPPQTQPQQQFHFADSKAAEYRRQLELQIKEAQDKRQKQKEEQYKYDQSHKQDLADYIHSAAAHTNRRGQSDITKTPKQEPQSKIEARLKYQHELKQQMEEQLQQKQLRQKQAKIEAMEEEQRLQRERDQLAGRERKEILKEGGKVTVQEQPQVRRVNRSQFEQSGEDNSKKQADDTFLVNSPPVVDLSPRPTSDIGPFQMPSSGQGFNYPPTPTASQPSQQQVPQQFYATQQPPINNQHLHTHQQQWQQSRNLQSQLQQMPSYDPSYQHPPQYIQPPPPQNLQQVDWAQQQRMFEDQQKMIQMYQQALEQILTYRNHYFEQAMQMRENMLREREQMLEFEKLKQAQQIEMAQLEMVKRQLDVVQERRQELAPALQSHLNEYIDQQREQIMSMSQSQMASVLREAAAAHEAVVSEYQQPTCVGETVMEEIQSQESDLQSAELEMSLNAQTKLVKVPGELHQRLPTAQRDEILLATWNENSIEKAIPIRDNQSPLLPQPRRQDEALLSVEYKRQLMSAASLNDKKAAITGSSFYDQTLKNQKVRDDIQQVEMQKQRERIFGNAPTSVQRESIESLREPDTPSLHNVQAQSQDSYTSPIQNIAAAAEEPELVEKTSTVQTKVYQLPSETADGDYYHFTPTAAAEQDRAAAAEFLQIVEDARRLQRELQTPSERPQSRPVPLPSAHKQSNFSETQEFQVPLVVQQDGMLRESYSVIEDVYPQSSPREYEPTPRKDSPLCGIERQNQNQSQILVSEGLPYSSAQEEDTNEQYTYPEFTVDEARKSTQGELLDDKQRKEQEMREIAELIRRAQLSTNNAVVSAEKHKQRQQIAQAQEQSESAQSQDEESGERNILADLDQIINNLEAQKNMQTFGYLEPLAEKKDLLSQKAIQEEFEASSQSVINIAQGTGEQIDYFQSQKLDSSPLKEQQEVLPKQKWRTLQEARENRPTTGKSSRSQGKAPLAPRTTSKEHDNKSRASARDASSPQLIGKFSQMAMQRQNSDKSQDRSQTSKSPNRVGQYAQMAMVNISRQQSNTDQDRSITSKSPQRVGKFTQMAAMNSNSPAAGDLSRQERSFTSKSPQRVGKFAQMALNSSKLSNGSQGSPSLRAGKFATLAMQANKGSDISQEDLEHISRKYSQERIVTPVQKSDKRQTMKIQQQSLLRPVTTSNYSSRYQTPHDACSD